MAIQPVNLREVEKNTANIYEAVIVAARRARQINDEDDRAELLRRLLPCHVHRAKDRLHELACEHVQSVGAYCRLEERNGCDMGRGSSNRNQDTNLPVPRRGLGPESCVRLRQWHEHTIAGAGQSERGLCRGRSDQTAGRSWTTCLV